MGVILNYLLNQTHTHTPIQLILSEYPTYLLPNFQSQLLSNRFLSLREVGGRKFDFENENFCEEYEETKNEAKTETKNEMKNERTKNEGMKNEGNVL